MRYFEIAKEHYQSNNNSLTEQVSTQNFQFIEAKLHCYSIKFIKYLLSCNTNTVSIVRNCKKYNIARRETGITSV